MEIIQTYGNSQFVSVYYGFAPNAYDFERYFCAQPELSDTITAQANSLTIKEIRNLISDGKKNGSFTSH